MTATQAGATPQALRAATRAEQNVLLTAGQLADRWQVRKAHVYRLARENVIPSVPIGRYYRFRLAAIEAWEQAQERGGVGGFQA